ncbi:biopolymer transporter ExbD [Salibaculum sp.]|uniref:ExbD/TolR family protein n=1 Tax=Salibaculum sp. TaxID=2855480 RepID=UPI002B49A86A|nr:biopolymer transporter ExbD [Salibaculum sp.]HKL69341.1 biopolymer transporter ExbD [Salibaculum sp.]
MQFTAPIRRPRHLSRDGAIVPMINVVFLLLIFFMMTSRIAPAPPVEVSPPEANPQALAEGDAMLWITAAGEPAFDGLRGAAVWPALAALPAEVPLTVAADAALPATRLAAILSRLNPERAVELVVRE